MLQVTIDPVDAAGRRYRISLEKTAADKGFIRIDPDGLADVTVVKLYALRSTGPDAIICWGDVWGPDPTIACRLLAASAGVPARLQVEIRGSLLGKFDGVFDYRVSPEEFQRAGAFLKDAGFPPASALA